MITKSPVITVDGPGGTGKGTLCGQLSELLGWHLLDSGALYRVLGYAAQQQRVNLEDIPSLEKTALELDLDFKKSGELVSVLLEGKDISAQIRTEESGNIASKVAAIPEVRSALFQRQQSFRQPPGLVADGRDMGTVIFPDADLKIFLTASPEVRAGRRYKQLKEKGNDANLAHLLEDIAERDRRDSQRQVAPLKPAKDAIIIDTSDLSIEQVIAKVLVMVKERISL